MGISVASALGASSNLSTYIASRIEAIYRRDPYQKVGELRVVAADGS